MKKKALLILTIITLCFIVNSLVFAASDTILPKIIWSSEQKIVNIDDEITLNVKIDDLSGGSIRNLELTYNDNQLSYISGGTFDADGKIKYSEEIKEDDKVIEFKFKVKEEALGSIKFKVSAKYYDEKGELTLTTPTYKDNTKLSVYEKSNNNDISFISVNNKSSLHLSGAVYSILLQNKVDKANIVINSHSKANIALKKDAKVLAQEVGQLTKEIELSGINNSYIIEIIAENGDVKTYSLKINREPNSTSGNIINKPENVENNEIILKNEETIPTVAVPNEIKNEEIKEELPKKDVFLKSLSVSHGKLTPEFDKNILTYGMKVGLDVENINVTAISDDKEAKIKITGNENLREGINKVKIEVSNEGISRTYVITVNKTNSKDESDASLQFLNIENVLLSPEFDPKIYEYTCIIPLELNSLNISTMATQEGTVLVISGNENLKVGENIITIEVTSENGEISHKYTIKAIKVDQIYEGAINETQTVQLRRNNKIAIFLIICIIAILALGILYLMLKYKYEKDKVRNRIIEDMEKKKTAEEKEDKE